MRPQGSARWDARCQRGGMEGCITLAKVCMQSENHAKNFAKEFMQSVGLRLARAQGAADLSAARIPPGLVFLNFEPCQCQI